MWVLILIIIGLYFITGLMCNIIKLIDWFKGSDE